MQAELVSDDLLVMERVLQTAIDAGRLPAETWEQVDLAATPPSLQIRNALHEDQRYRIEHAAGILSPQTWCQRVGLDYDTEMDQLARHAASSAGFSPRVNHSPTRKRGREMRKHGGTEEIQSGIEKTESRAKRLAGASPSQNDFALRFLHSLPSNLHLPFFAIFCVLLFNKRNCILGAALNFLRISVFRICFNANFIESPSCPNHS